MHFLICIGGEQYSRDTLRFGISLAAGLKADLSILFVRPTVSQMFKVEARAARDKLEQWAIETPEVRVMKGVEKMLLEMNFLRTVDGKVDIRHLPKPAIRGAYEYHLYGAEGENVRIRVREGDVVHTILRETMEVPYDLVVVGAPGDGGRLVRQIIDYLETSVLVVKNPQPLERYRLLLCLKKSPSAQRAQDFAVRTARILGSAVDVLCIYTYPWEEHFALDLAEHARRLLTRLKVPHTVRIRRGGVSRTILAEATAEHIVVLGGSERHSLAQFLFESVPVKIGREGKSSVLVVK